MRITSHTNIRFEEFGVEVADCIQCLQPILVHVLDQQRRAFRHVREAPRKFSLCILYSIAAVVVVAVTNKVIETLMCKE